MGGYPIPGLDGDTPSQVWMGVPHPRSRHRGLPIRCQDGGYPTLLMGGTPQSKIEWGTPHPGLDGYPPIRRQIIKASICYAAGGLPLAFTQEDFLVANKAIPNGCKCLVVLEARWDTASSPCLMMVTSLYTDPTSVVCIIGSLAEIKLKKHVSS